MDYEKLIKRLKKPCWGESAHLVDKERMEAATALSTLQSENKKLRAEMSQARESLDFARTKDAEIVRIGMELGHLKKHMERLTHRLGNGEITCNMARDDCRKMGGDCQIDSKILDHLAAYEETGLEPEEIDRILDAYERGMTLRTESAQRLEIVKDIKTTRLRELSQADKLIGKTVYYPYAGEILEKRVSHFIIYDERRANLPPKENWFCINDDKSETFGFEDIGKTVFLTRKESEATLRKEKK